MAGRGVTAPSPRVFYSPSLARVESWTRASLHCGFLVEDGPRWRQTNGQSSVALPADAYEVDPAALPAGCLDALLRSIL